MDFLSLQLIQQGGPWALLLTVLSGVVFAVVRGVLIPGPVADRAVGGYVETIKSLQEELTYYRTAVQAKDATIAKLTDQQQKMLEYAALGTHAIEDIVREARKRGGQDA